MVKPAIVTEVSLAQIMTVSASTISELGITRPE
jgi:hypothetical protein